MRSAWIMTKTLYTLVAILFYPIFLFGAFGAIFLKKDNDIAIFSFLALITFTFIGFILFSFIPNLFRRTALKKLNEHKKDNFNPQVYFESLSLDRFIWLDCKSKQFLYYSGGFRPTEVFDSFDKIIEWEAFINSKKSSPSNITFKLNDLNLPIIPFTVSTRTIEPKLAQLELFKRY